MTTNKFFHQFINRNYYVPDWPLCHLFLGTFNPSYGRQVKYYYGRCENRTWDLLSDVFGIELYPTSDEFLDRLKTLGIGCMDVIHSVEFTAAEGPPEGYRDADIINCRVTREYNTKEIIKVIGRNPGVQVYSTWGKGPKLLEWKKEIEVLENLVPLVSPSMLAKVSKGTKKFEYMLKDWREKVRPL